MTDVICAVLRPDSAHAVTVAGDLAHRLSLPLVLVDVRPVQRPVPAVPSSTAASPTAIGDATLGDPLAAAPPPVAPATDLEDLARRAEVRPVRFERLEAPPVHALEALSARQDVELLVAADHGGGPLATALTAAGPRAALRGLDAPLVLVPERAAARRRTETPLLMCAVDDDEMAATVTAFAAEFAHRLGAELELVHAGDDEERTDHLVRRCDSVLPDGAARRFHRLPAERTSDLHVWAADRGAEMLVAGRPGRGRLGSALRGSVVHGAAQHGDLPVVVVPDAVRGR